MTFEESFKKIKPLNKLNNEETSERENILHTALKLAVRDLNTFVVITTKGKGIPYHIEDYIQEAKLFLKDKEE